MSAIDAPVLHERDRTPSIDDEKKEDVFAADVDLAVAEGDLEAVEEDIRAAQADAEKLTYEDARLLVQEIVDEYQLDPNFPPHVMESAVRFLQDPTLKDDAAQYRKVFAEIKLAASFLRDNSPYPEVRAVVSNTDDPSIAVSTLRSWIIGLILACGGAACNQFFSPRQPGIFLSVYTAQVLAYPLGTLWARFVPNWFSLPIPFSGGKRLNLNPGPFTQKEHMLITVMANVSYSSGGLYTGDIYIIQKLPRFFNQAWATNFGYQATTSLSVQLLGYGIAGITRRFLVYPASCIWPANLGTIALNRAFHRDSNVPANGWKISRLGFFAWAFLGMFLYFWFPNMIFPALSVFSWMTWISPNNVNLAAICGTQLGLGVNPFPTLDWNWMFLSDPIITPLFSNMNQYIGAWMVVPITAAIWFSNSFNTGYLGITSNRVFDNTGQPYNVSLIVTAEGLFNETAFKEYSPAYLGASNLVVYIMFFALYTATISYAFLYHRHEIARGFRSLAHREGNEGKDIHNRLMQAYPEAPEWWYLIILLIAIALGLIGLLAYPTNTNVSSLFFGIAVSVIFVVPVGIITAVANTQVTLNVLAEFVGGAAYPGNYLAMLFFKTYGVITCSQAVSFASDLKLGHYTKIPPRVMFAAQTVATVASTFVSIAIVNWQMTGVQDLCAVDQPEKFTCPGINTFFTAAVLWGTIGPKRIFGIGALYNPVLYAFLVGLLLPLPVYFYVRRNPRSWARYIHVPAIIYGGVSGGSPYNLSYYTPIIYTALFFNFYVRRRYLAWWSKYAYILTTAFSVGIAISAIFQFIVDDQSNGFPAWWGNTVTGDGCDGGGPDGFGCPHLAIPAEGFFHPGPGEF
ncbi:OPT-domain-containing protein [Exidia glandulosa HHB12029]|uniref:OPT-domain-containing protein n=1 Tax=Exidia glandulosa HHB12029 TaxID=1314781 RepID=A0A166AYY0_EXIGL|nr:OPT-domain-containing protein [Exidia glandulosa HHB12029]